MKVDWQDSYGWLNGKYQKAWTWTFSEEYSYDIFENAGQYWPVSSMSALGISPLGCSSLRQDTEAGTRTCSTRHQCEPFARLPARRTPARCAVRSSRRPRCRRRAAIPGAGYWEEVGNRKM